MRCPVCETTKLAIAERQGIEIDYCPDCRGVWLDRGELDKIIERSAAESGSDDESRGSARPSFDERGHKHGKKRKKGGMLGELFDF
ncbi:MAG: zf-TFIIB domain-containing protein [Halofilum sp. (in: g-proteobacteria)]|nr:zf-TFIIB domain-containing protein [Halofilum sp. (in: g-proteobacteria)]